ncbi:hypothetical protein J40TS1_47170 [Paenibacillus montaniterrae]|uniref:Uncharacterized protein n=1 Tax=Paenibacillus montaniterrae TaxID=429341 RepID=A0A919YT98_9BACL|nr:hypothetical protein [Paenibacillus montaniterrae]GIP19075.1 hypothetical protein J40TS1_47170 [Paenibacillus montaniterrae]
MKKILSIILSLGLLLTLLDTFRPLQTVEAATKVSIASNVSAVLYDAQLVKDATGKLASFTVKFENKSQNNVPLIDYWAKISGKDNRSYVTRLMSEDKEKRYVIPNSTTYLTYYAYVGANDALTDLSLDIIKWDFNAKDYERIVGKLKSTGNGVTPYKKSEETNLDKALLNVLLGSYKMYSDKNYHYFNIEVVMRNKASAALDTSKLSYYLTDGKGTLIPLLSANKEEGSASLNPQERRTTLLSATLDKSFAKNNAKVVVMYNDEAGSIQLPRVTFALPALKDTSAVKSSATSTFSIGNHQVNMTVNEQRVSQSNGSTFTDTSIVLENKSVSKMTMPNFEYYIKTAQGFLYPLVPEENAPTELLPNIKKEIKLRGELPKDADLKKSQFVVFYSEEKGQKSNFLGNFEIVLGGANQPTKPATNKTTYQDQVIEQTSLQRIPSGDSDLLIAEFKILNKSAKAKARLQLSGQFEIDGVKLPADATKIVYLDNLLTIGKDQSYRVITYTKIPYVQSTDNVLFNMIEKLEDKENTIHQFKLNEMTSARLLAANEPYVIDTTGGKGEVQVQRSDILKGKQNDLFLTQLVYESKEQRSVVPTQLVGYITNSNGDVVELTIKPYTSRIMPNGKVVLYGSAVIPKDYEQQKINLYFGETVKTGEEEISNVMVNPVYTQNLIKADSPIDSFTALPFMKYDISLSSFYAQFDSTDGLIADTINLSFNYDITVRDDAPEYADAHRIVIEYVDPERPSVTFSKSFEIGGEKDDKFTIGTRNKQTMSFSDSALQFTNPGQYIVNVYEEYDGFKKLIASKTFLFGNVQ